MDFALDEPWTSSQPEIVGGSKISLDPQSVHCKSFKNFVGRNHTVKIYFTFFQLEWKGKPLLALMFTFSSYLISNPFN